MFLNRSGFRPMLAAESTDEILIRKLREGPLLCTPKLDGIRCIQFKDGLRSRSLKPIRSRYAQETFDTPEFVGADGELIDGPPNAPDTMSRTSSAVMAFDGGSPSLKFYLFDMCAGESPGMPYQERLELLSEAGRLLEDYNTQVEQTAVQYLIIKQTVAESLQDVMAFEEQCVSLGYEGIIARDPKAPYKFGRSTQPQGWMLKIKRFRDSEAIIRGWEALQHNANEAVIDNLGLQKRGSSKEGKVDMPALGKFHCHDPVIGWDFSVGSGLTQAQREDFWVRREEMMGQKLTYKYLPHGSIDAPRHPIFKAIRHPDDMS
jgi:DNA ligase-1